MVILLLTFPEFPQYTFAKVPFSVSVSLLSFNSFLQELETINTTTNRRIVL